MNKNHFFLVILVMALVLGMTACPTDGGGGETDTWTNVTNFSQVNGSWEAPSLVSGTVYDINLTQRSTNHIITFNAAKNTISASGSRTETYSGGNINIYWSNIKANAENMKQMDGITVNVNDATHSITVTYNNYYQILTDSQLIQMGYQINQNGSKLKVVSMNIEIIYTKYNLQQNSQKDALDGTTWRYRHIDVDFLLKFNIPNFTWTSTYSSNHSDDFSVTGTYSISGNTVILTSPEDGIISGTLSGNTLSFASSGGPTFIKQ
jgi:hypothetical protein